MTSIRLPALFLITSTLTLTAPWMFPAQAAEPVAAVQDWPMWSGPTANWLASPDEKGLIADLNQAKLLWTSEDKACGGVRGQSRRYGGRVGMKPSAGGAVSHCLSRQGLLLFSRAQGSRFIEYLVQPRSRVMAEQFLADLKLIGQGFNKEEFLDLWASRPMDVVLCMNADTGKTIWKSLPGRTLPRRLGQAANANNTLLQVPERSSLQQHGCPRALDAESGELAWEAWNSEEKQVQRQAVIERGHLQEKRLQSDHGPSGPVRRWVGNLHSCCIKEQLRQRKSLIAFDGISGEQKWRVDEVGPVQGAPSLWFHDGVSYIVAHPSWGMLPVCGWPMAR